MPAMHKDTVPLTTEEADRVANTVPDSPEREALIRELLIKYDPWILSTGRRNPALQWEFGPNPATGPHLYVFLPDA
jgi:hypothetical protein